MSEVRENPGMIIEPRNSPLVPETLADSGNTDRREQYDLTKEERVFLRTLYRVLPKLVGWFEKPTDDPSPLLSQKSKSIQDEKAVQGEPNSSKVPHEQAQDPASYRHNFKKAKLGLLSITWKFRRFEERIRSDEGGAQMMDALKRLEYAALNDDMDVPGTMRIFAHASPLLMEAFKKLGDEFVEGKHVTSLRELDRFCSRFKHLYLRDTREWRTTEWDILEILPSLSKHIDDVTQGLSVFFKSAIPIILTAQQTAQTTKYNNTLAAATFLSAVTATTLQLPYAYNTNPHTSPGVAINTLWVVALVFSTASGLSCLVGFIWYRNIRRILLLSDWAALWLEHGPNFLLKVAYTAFSVGLCLFAFSSWRQYTIVSTLVAAYTAMHIIALFVSLCLYGPEKVWPRTPLEYFDDIYLKFGYLRRRQQMEMRYETLLSEEAEARAERDVDAQPGKEVPELRTRGAKKNPSVASSKESAISMSGVTNSSKGAAFAAEEPVKGVERANARTSLGPAQTPATSSTADPNPGSGSSTAIQIWT